MHDLSYQIIANSALVRPISLGWFIGAFWFCCSCVDSKAESIDDLRTVPAPVVGHFVNAPTHALSYPIRLATQDDVLYVTDYKHGSVFGYRGESRILELADMDRPLGIAVRGDLLFVGSVGRGSVEAYDLKTRQYSFSLGSGAGEFSMPNAIDVSPEGEEIFVADSKENVVAVYNLKGTLLKKIGGEGSAEGQFRFPVAVSVSNGRIVVGDQGNHRVQVFDRNGTYRFSIGEALYNEVTSYKDYLGRFTRVQGVAEIGEDIAILDSYHGYIQIFDNAGKGKGFIGRRGQCADCVALGLDLAVSPNETILVADPEMRRWISLPMEIRATP